jgi:hypothetical protein
MKTLRFTSDQLNARVLQVIQDTRPTIDRRITKEELSLRVYGICTENAIRKVRYSVARLRDMGHPIVADSGHAGYYLDPNKVGVIIADMKSRIIEMSATIRALERGYEPPKPVLPKSEMREAVQMGIFG